MWSCNYAYDAVKLSAKDICASMIALFMLTTPTVGYYSYSTQVLPDKLTGRTVVAAFESLSNIISRFNKSVEDGQGSDCVAVIDIELDDYANVCSNGHASRLQAIGQTGVPLDNSTSVDPV